MNPERWNRIEAVLDEVLDAPESERAEVLARACGDDAELRREVETLLHASELAGTRFDVPPLLVAADALSAEEPPRRDHVEPGDRIGAWRIVRLLGRGGMGAVYLAERADGAFEMNAALKIVKRGMDTDEILERFQHERRILARLQHRNIAGLLDGGVTPDGLPYFVMELAAGEPIDTWCDGHTLIVRERLELFQTVCEAVQYAHANLIVHRDLKPGNILVSDDSVKLLDFGIAKLLGPDADAPTALTRAFTARLTPQYAAPEQIRGLATTTAADVYSLGVILYELVCGRSPYRLEGKTLLEMEQTICNDEPRPPSAAVRLRAESGPEPEQIARMRGLSSPASLEMTLRGDIDAICLMALRKSPEQRYVSAAALAEDIQRYLDGRPVRAHPPTRRYRISKFVRRNRALVALTSLTAVVLVLATVLTTIMASLARAASERQEQEAERAKAARDFVVNTLGGFDPDIAPGQRLFTGSDLVARGRLNLETIDVLDVKATVMNTLGQVAFNLGERAAADSLFHEALEILRPRGDSPDLATTYMGLGELYRRDRRYLEAVHQFREALRIRRRAFPPHHRSIAESQRALAFALYNLEQAESAAEAAELYADLLTWADLPEDVAAGALEGLADLRLRQDSLQVADSLYRRALELRERTQHASHPDIARTLWGAATVVLRQGRLDRAEQDYRRALDILRASYGASHRDIAFGLLFLGHVLRRQDRLAAAESTYVEAATMSERENAPGFAYTGRTWYYVGITRQQRGDHAGAVDALRRAVEVYRTGRTGIEPDVASEWAEADVALGRSLVAQGDAGEAVAALREAWAIFSGKEGEAALAPDSAWAVRTAGLLADAYRQLGRPDSADWFRARGPALSRPGGT